MSGYEEDLRFEGSAKSKCELLKSLAKYWQRFEVDPIHTCRTRLTGRDQSTSQNTDTQGPIDGDGVDQGGNTIRDTDFHFCRDVVMRLPHPQNGGSLEMTERIYEAYQINEWMTSCKDEKYGWSFEGDRTLKEYPAHMIRIGAERQLLGFDPGQDLLVVASRPR